MRRIRYAFTYCWALYAMYTLMALFVIAIWGGSSNWLVVVLTLGVYVIVFTRLFIPGLRLEAAARKIAHALGWKYSLSGPRVDEYGISASPFNGPGRLQVSHWMTGSFQGRHVEAFFASSDILRWGLGDFILMARLDREYPTVRLVPARGSERQIQGQTAVGTEAEEFNRRWRVLSGDPEFAHAFLSPQVMNRLLSEPDPPETLTISGRYLFLNGKLSRVMTRGRLPLLADLIELIPGGVVAKFAEGRAPKAGEHLALVDAVLARDLPRDPTVFALPEPRPWVTPVAIALGVGVPIVGPLIAAVMWGVESRRGAGSSLMMEWAIVVGLVELVVLYVYFFML